MKGNKHHENSDFTKLTREEVAIDKELGAVTGSTYVFAARETGKRTDGNGTYDKYGIW